MKRNFTQTLCSLLLIFSLGFLLNPTEIIAQSCATPTGISTNNVSNSSATANWTIDNNVDHYRIRYKVVGASTWMTRNNIVSDNKQIDNLFQGETYVWKVQAFCSAGNLLGSPWSVVDTFMTTSYLLDCNGVPNGTAFIDSCGNCVGGLTGSSACIPFSPAVAISLSSLECNTVADITFTTSQDPNEPDISSSIFSSDGGYFDFTGLSSNDIIGSGIIIAGGGYINISTTLMVDFIITSDKISVKAVDNTTGNIYGSFTIENSGNGILIIATSLPDNNNVTSGNSQTISLNGLLINPSPSALTFTSTINSELGDIDTQTSIETIACADCNGNFGGGAFTDDCGNCVEGNTGDVACIPFSPTVSVVLSNTDCDSLTDLIINVSQDPNEPDMSTSLFVSDAGSFAISLMSVGDIIGNATMTAGGGSTAFNTVLIVSAIISSNQAIIQSQDIVTGLVLGSFTISNSNPGVNIIAQSIPDNNNVTSGNSQSVTFSNVFVNPGQSTLTFTSSINSELGDIDVQNFPFNIVCLCIPNTPDSLYASSVQMYQSTMNWNAVTNADHYEVRKRPQGIPPWEMFYSTANAHTKYNLTASTTYEWQVRSACSIDSSSVSAWSSKHLFTTLTPCALDIVTACNSYTWNGITYSQTGIYQYSDSTNPAGCTDSLILTINSSTTSSVSVTECDTYSWNGITYTTSGVYTFASTNANGCDSTATLNLTITPSTTSSVSVTECDTYSWNGITYTTSGVYTFASTNANGCDSTATLNLTITPSTTSSSTITECDTYPWNGITYTTSGVYTFASTNANGCDSIATLNLTINPSNTSSVDVTTCGGYMFNGSVYFQSGAYTYTTTNVAGCDSTVTLNLTINNATSSNIGVTECDSYIWNGTTYTSSGVYSFHTTNAAGCDSTATLALVIFNSTTSNTSATSCNDYTWNGITYSSSGAYTYLTTNVDGCDSIATLNLTINPSNTSSVDVTTCGGYMFNGSVYFQSGAYTYTTTNVAGCDSTVTLNLTINNATSSNIGVTECDSYIWNGTTYTSSGVYSFHTTNAAGCDSTATLALVIFNSTTSNTSATSCNDYTWNGITYSSSGAYTYLTTNVDGCDSIATLNLTINYSSTSNTTITATNSYSWNGVVYVSSGIYTYTTTNAVGCDSIATLNLKINICDVPANTVTTNILLDRATLSWDAVTGAHHYQFRFKEVSGSTWLILDNYSTSRTKTGLTAGNDYHWQVRTLCDATGSSASQWSDTISFSTPVICTLPVSTTNITIGLDFASFSWAAVNGMSEYIVRVKEASGAWSSWVYDTVTTNTYTSYGLSNSTNYHWQVGAACAPLGANNSGFTTYTNFTTLTPCTDPSLLTIDSVGVNEAYLSWVAPAGTDHFVVLYSELGTGIWNSATTTTTSIALSGLATYSAYEWSVLAFCEASGLNNSDTIVGTNFSTANPCTSPSGLVASNILLDRITINWNTVVLAHHYEIRVRELGTSTWTHIINVYGNSRTKTGLSASTTYEWEIRSICTSNGSSFSDWSATQATTTLSPCASLTNETTTNIALTTATLTWDASPGAYSYRVRFKESSAAWSAWQYDTILAPNNSINKSALTAGIDYHWQVQVICESTGLNNSGFTSYQNFTTTDLCSNPHSLSVSQITLNSAKLKMYGPNNPDHYYVLYKDITASVWDTVVLSGVDINGGYASKVVTGLSSAITYEWKSQSSCQADDSNISAFVNGPNVTTITPCAVPSNLSALVTGQDAIFSWDAVPGTAFYTAKYRVLNGNWQTVTNLNSSTYTATNLGFGLSFEWSVSSNCDWINMNYSSFSPTDTFNTASCPTPQNISVSNILTNKATINWTFNTSVHHYSARARVAGTTVWTKNISHIYTGNRIISGLSDGVTYEFQIRSACTNDTSNVSAWSSLQVFSTLVICNSKPTSTTTANITLTSADLSFTGTANAVAYPIRFKESSAAWGAWVYDTLLAPTVSISKAGLNSGTGYHWQVKAICDLAGTSSSAWTNYETFTTDKPCSTPFNLMVGNIYTTHNSALVSWNGQMNISYLVMFKDTSVANWDTLNISSGAVVNITSLPFGVSATTSNSGPATYLAIQGLTSATSYEWQVISECSSYNVSSAVVGSLFTTLPPCTTPSGLSTTAISATAATLNWGATVTANHYALRGRLQGSSVWAFDIPYENNTNRTIHNLPVGQTFEWQVRSVCSNDTSEVSAWSSLQVFSTLVICNSKPTSTTTANITLTSADLSFTGTANAVAYPIRFKESSAAWGAWVYDTLLAPTASISKAGLNSGTGYHWQVKAICDLAGTGSSVWTNYETFTTDKPCSIPFNLMVGNIYTTHNSALVSWNGQMNISYLVMFKDTSVANWDTLNISSGAVVNITSLPFGVSATTSNSGPATYLAIQGLTSATSYEWQVISECSSYNVSSAVVGSLFTTLPPCTTPSGLSTTAISATAATLNWGATVTAHHYALRGRLQGSSVWAFDISNQNNTNRTIHNLPVGQTFEWQVRSVCSNDTSEVSAWSSLQVFSTSVSCDNPPANLNETNIDLNIATLNWDVQPNAQAYEVRFRNSSAAWSTLVYTTLTATTLDKSGLNSGNGYHWQVRAICDTSNNIVSPWSSWSSFNTPIPCALPTSLLVLSSITTLTSASLRWYGPNIDYYVMFKESAASNWDTVIVHGTSVTNVSLLPFGVNVTTSTAGAESNVTITGLSSATTYQWHIISACTGLNMSLAVMGADVTTLTPCAIPSNLTSTVTTSTATINWDVVPGAVKYDLRKMDLGGSSWGYINNLTSTTRTIYGLTPGATYIWEVRSHCDMNNGNSSGWSSTEEFTTQVVCTKPINPLENNISGTTAALKWDAIPTGSWGYRLMYLKQGASWNTKIVDTVNTNIYNAIGLDVNTTYRWRVQGICDQSGLNNSNFTSFQKFTTLSSIRITAGNVELGENLNIYPNPTKGFFNISFISDELDNFEISIVDVFGKLISNEDRQNFVGEYTKQVDLSDYPRGIYMVQIKTQNSFVTKRIVLQ